MCKKFFDFPNVVENIKSLFVDIATNSLLALRRFIITIIHIATAITVPGTVLAGRNTFVGN